MDQIVSEYVFCSSSLVAIAIVNLETMFSNSQDTQCKFSAQMD